MQPNLSVILACRLEIGGNLELASLVQKDPILLGIELGIYNIHVSPRCGTESARMETGKKRQGKGKQMGREHEDDFN